MNTYEAYVRITCNGMVIKTWIKANSNQEAYFLLQGQYGQDNIVTLPSAICD